MSPHPVLGKSCKPSWPQCSSEQVPLFPVRMYDLQRFPDFQGCGRAGLLLAGTDRRAYCCVSWSLQTIRVGRMGKVAIQSAQDNKRDPTTFCSQNLLSWGLLSQNPFFCSVGRGLKRDYLRRGDRVEVPCVPERGNL